MAVGAERSTHNLVPVAHTFVEDCETPVSAFLKLRGEGPAFLLESAEQGRLGRWSFLGFRPRSILRWSGGLLSEWRAEAAAGPRQGTAAGPSFDAPAPSRAVAEAPA